jgi:hypothetical protein
MTLNPIKPLSPQKEERGKLVSLKMTSRVTVCQLKELKKSKKSEFLTRKSSQKF